MVRRPMWRRVPRPRHALDPCAGVLRESDQSHVLLNMMAWMLNVIIPGAGLIVRRREWLGFSLALVFGICGNVALAGWLIAPAAVPGWLVQVAAGLCCLSWLLSQWLMLRQGILLDRRAAGLAKLLHDARSAIDSGDSASARLALDSSAAMDDERAELYVLRARLCDLEGDRQGMRAAWRHVLRLDHDHDYRAEAKRALEDHRHSR